MVFRWGQTDALCTIKACRQSMCGALRRGRHELDGRRQGRGGRRRSRLRAAIREREAPTVQTSGQKHLSSTLTLKYNRTTKTGRHGWVQKSDICYDVDDVLTCGIKMTLNLNKKLLNYLPNLASSSSCFFARLPQMVAMTPCRLKQKRSRSTMTRQMKTPAKATPMMAPLDRSCGGANPELFTPVDIKQIVETVSEVLMKVRAAETAILRFWRY